MPVYLKILVPILIGQIAVNLTNVYLTSAGSWSGFVSMNLRFALVIIAANFLTILGWFVAYQNNISLFLIFVITLGTAITTQSLGAIYFVHQMPTIKQIAAMVLLLVAGLLAR